MEKQFSQRQLIDICKVNGTQLVSFHQQSGQFSVWIPHFTKYNFNGSDSTEKKGKTRN
jgi:hypothetical protein